MSEAGHAEWDERHRGKPAGEAEPFLVEMLARIPRGVVLDVAAGRGRNALELARAGMRIVAVDYSIEAMRLLAATARDAQLAIWPIVANLDNFHLTDESFDAIVNINFLDRALFPKFERALRPGGVLIAEHISRRPGRDRSSARSAFSARARRTARARWQTSKIEDYREGLVAYPNGDRAFRASMLARRRSRSDGVQADL